MFTERAGTTTTDEATHDDDAIDGRHPHGLPSAGSDCNRRFTDI